MTHRILFCTIGASPAIAVETAWWLIKKRPEGAWLPDQTIIVTTTFELEAVRAQLQAPDGAMAKLLGRPPATAVYVPRRGRAVDIYHSSGEAPVTTKLKNWTHDGEPLSDVATPEDALVMSAVIWSAMVNAVKTPHSEVHVSFAGGRKTMSAHAVTAFSILGRFTDSASHVLVSGPFDESGKPEIPCPFENTRDFWRPDQGGTITMRGGRLLDPADARVELVPVTVPLMRNRLPRIESLENADLVEVSEMINLARRLKDAPFITLRPATNEIQIGAVRGQIGYAQFALLRLLLTAARDQWPTSYPSDSLGGGWLTYDDIAEGVLADGTPVRQIMHEFLIDAEKVKIGGGSEAETGSAMAWKTQVLDKKTVRADNAKRTLNTTFSRLKDSLRDLFGPDAASLIEPERKKKPVVRFRMSSAFPTQGMTVQQ
jgi:CRISPR-associated protein (TIGR02584 family)